MERKEPALISLLARLFIKPDPAREEPETRRAYGVLCGIVGICLYWTYYRCRFLQCRINCHISSLSYYG